MLALVHSKYFGHYKKHELIYPLK